MKNININDLLNINNANIIDISNNFIYMKGHIPGGTNKYYLSRIIIKSREIFK